MAYKYTGRARTFTFGGRIYANQELYAKHPDLYDASYDSPIVGMTKEKALTYTESNLHSFEDTTDGEDLLEKTTAPTADIPDQDISTVKPEALKESGKK